MPNRLAMRITEEVMNMASQITGVEVDEEMDLTQFAYLVITVISPIEMHAKFMTEDEVLSVYRTDSTLQLIN